MCIITSISRILWLITRGKTMKDKRSRNSICLTIKSNPNSTSSALRALNKNWLNQILKGLLVNLMMVLNWRPLRTDHQILKRGYQIKSNKNPNLSCRRRSMLHHGNYQQFKRPITTEKIRKTLRRRKWNSYLKILKQISNSRLQQKIRRRRKQKIKTLERKFSKTCPLMTYTTSRSF